MLESQLDITNLMLYALLIGTGATAVMDIWALFLKICFDIPSLNYSLVGRWLAYIPQGIWKHKNITNSVAVVGESVIGWIAHYLIGIFFAVILLSLWGVDWVFNPTLVPAIILAIASLVFPFFVMQPGMGLGIAASKIPQPNTARLRSVLAHVVFGVGLYVSAMFLGVVI